MVTLLLLHRMALSSVPLMVPSSSRQADFGKGLRCYQGHQEVVASRGASCPNLQCSTRVTGVYGRDGQVLVWPAICGTRVCSHCLGLFGAVRDWSDHLNALDCEDGSFRTFWFLHMGDTSRELD